MAVDSLACLPEPPECASVRAMQCINIVYHGMPAATTIKITPDLKTRLNGLKRHPRESYSDVIARLVDLALDDEPLSEDAIRGIEEALEDIKSGRLHTEDDIGAEFGV